MRTFRMIGIVVIALGLAGGRAAAQTEQVPLDFITGEGWFAKQEPLTGPAGSPTFGISGASSTARTGAL